MAKRVQGDKGTRVQGCNINSILDFGSGYGRVARFIPYFFSSTNNFYASEVKLEAVRFLKSFGYKGIEHSSNPKFFIAPSKMDFIFAGSVFTHLPVSLFLPWLDKLIETLSENGLLVFSFHNYKTYQGKQKGEFVFESLAEDGILKGVEDRLVDNTEYGSCYIKDSLLISWLLDRSLSYKIIENGFGGTQDLVIASQK